MIRTKKEFMKIAKGMNNPFIKIVSSGNKWTRTAFFLVDKESGIRHELPGCSLDYSKFFRSKEEFSKEHDRYYDQEEKLFLKYKSWLSEIEGYLSIKKDNGNIVSISYHGNSDTIEISEDSGINSSFIALNKKQLKQIYEFIFESRS